MTTHDTRRSQARRTDADEIAGLLPAPAEWDVPREQYLHRKELLMRQIDRDQALGHAQTTPSTRPSRRLLRPAVMVPVTALAMGAVALTVVTATGNAGHSATAGPSQHATTSDTMRPAAALLGRISQATLKTDAIAVHDDQFTYRRAKIREADLTTNKAVVGPLRDMETWASQKQGHSSSSVWSGSTAKPCPSMPSWGTSTALRRASAGPPIGGSPPCRPTRTSS